ncbi:DNA topoisomerase 2-associated protein pat1 [Coemansia guatemalensis]|uniref:DNA topoisomerase 2-associated protein pat1 n=1 Tax=Coemansia guatemalensis TaxID=2761395 RepID=A0A9W8HZA9_9FUNG|nr:DNA topoisomerase 2-associated protein pat1 [Coemansia guatemalensis]
MSGSFFGGTNPPEDDPIARGRAAFLASKATDLDNRLESLALEDNLGDQLPEDQDTFNTETFDADVGEITSGEFDFFQNTLANQAKMTSPQQHQHQPLPPPPPPQDTMQMLQSMGVSINHPVVPEAGPGSEGADERRRITTLAELEAKIISQRSTPMSGVTQPARKVADPETIASRREQRLERESALTRYNNMMSQRDKEYIVRIQVSQLLTDDPAADDFYCHMYQLSRGAMFGAMQQQVGVAGGSGEATEAGRSPSAACDPERVALAGAKLQNGIGQERSAGAASSPAPKQQTGAERGQPQNQHLARARRSNTQSSMARMQQQVQRIVNEARRRPKVAHVAAEGALGKISVTSSRNPKQAIQVQRSHGGSVSQGSPGPLTEAGGALAGLGDARNPTAERRKTLRAIEEMYTGVLRLEQLVREQARLPNVADHPSVQGWVAAYSAAKELAWAELEATQPILNVYPHPLVRILAFSKGKRAVGRLVHHLSMDQVLALTTTIIANFESLDVCRVGSFGYAGAAESQQREETDLFLHAVMPAALGFLAEASLQIVNGLFALFMERNNVAWVARTRPALVFLVVVLGRTAALKQQSQQSQEAYQAAELYNHLFNSLRGSLATIFPQQPLGHMPNPTEDMHAWQFLAALATAASAEQQHALVAEAREKVLEKVQLAKDPRLPAEMSTAILTNVNVFLNALGLDASQVTT